MNQLLLLTESKPATLNKTIGIKRVSTQKNYRQPPYFLSSRIKKTIVVPVHGKKYIPNGTFLSII